MDLTGPHVYQGLAGFYIIRDPAEDALGLPSGAFDIPLLIQDKNFNSDNSLSYDHDFFFGLLGETAVVNGAATPHLDVGARKYRFRVLNGSNARPLALELHVGGSTTAEEFQVIASDGGLLPAPVELAVLPVAPAERYDVVVDFSKYPVGTKLDLVTAPPAELGALGLNDTGDTTGLLVPTGEGIVLGPVSAGGLIPSGVEPGSTPLPVMQFVVDRPEADSSQVPAQLARVERLNPADAVSEQAIVFRFDGEDWTLNDRKFDPTRIDVSSKLDQVYIWSLENDSPLPHPFHKHLSLFNVLDINGASPPSFMSGWKDTVMVPPFAKVRIVFKDESFTGTYVFHCHNLEHEDHGMMAQEQVEP
jgi:spore coat protein A